MENGDRGDSRGGGRIQIMQLTRHRIMNVGSPYNVMAGSQVNMEKVIQKFKKEAYEAEERKHEALRNNQIRSEQPIEKVLGSTYRGNSLEHEKIVLNRAIR